LETENENNDAEFTEEENRKRSKTYPYRESSESIETLFNAEGLKRIMCTFTDAL
jgi:hypothetical protein